MGLDDLIPEEAERSSRSSSSGSSEPSDPFANDDLISIGSPPNDKHFTEEQYEKVKRVVREEFGMSIGEVESLPSNERYKTLHEAVTFNPDLDDEEQTDLVEDDRCIVCGDAAGFSSTHIEGEPVHIHHTVGQLNEVLEDD